ncbi:MAG: nicotinamide riboside transporter PnuC [Gammaproteobacteria bacterium]|nr:nicotinamide riboside transporter PnuC [Gammaproteobacteria bacterium]
MSEIVQGIIADATAMRAWEAVAVILAIAYLLLAMKENILCWYCALFSTAIYTQLFWNVSLLMESALNVYYLAMAVFGWYQWKYGGREKSSLSIQRLTLQTNLLIIAAVFVAAGISGWLLSQHSQAAWPYLDSFTTWGSVATTFMVAKKILENWLYWLVIDSISIPLYVDRGLYLTAFLFFIYLFIVVAGFLNWRRRYQAQI